jgi:hypothetical protein
VSLVGKRFEILARYRHLEIVHLQYARWDLTRVDLVEPRTGVILCAIKPLDKSASAFGHGAPVARVACRIRRVRPATRLSTYN